MIDYYEFADEIGLTKDIDSETRDRIGFIRRESKARYVSEQVIWSINDEVELWQMPLTSKYDIEFESGGTEVKMETKVREYGHTKYPNLRISGSKCDFDKCDDWWILAAFNDGQWYIWDLSKYKPKYVKDGWTHWKYTAEYSRNYKVTEDCWVFDFSKADRSGRLKNIGI